ncbi:hypothetical protein J6590_029365 [Homalodisca vitripennis]|nr:hypothetical protein J6590_029365 [Homalodisca vitripennis]
MEIVNTRWSCTGWNCPVDGVQYFDGLTFVLNYLIKTSVVRSHSPSHEDVIEALAADPKSEHVYRPSFGRPSLVSHANYIFLLQPSINASTNNLLDVQFFCILIRHLKFLSNESLSMPTSRGVVAHLHIDSLCSKVETCNFSLRYLSSFLESHVLKSAHQGYFVPLMSYGMLFWGTAKNCEIDIWIEIQRQLSGGVSQRTPFNFSITDISISSASDGRGSTAMITLFIALLSAWRVSSRICPSVDIRNSVEKLELLRGCRVVEGHVHIVLMERPEEADFRNVSLPELREITDYLMFYRVMGIQSVGQLFPNLTLIRGHTLFADYALVLYEVFDLSEVALTSLARVTRGAVRIEKNPSKYTTGCGLCIPAGDTHVWCFVLVFIISVPS